MIRVVIADDQDMVRAGLRLVLDNQPDIEVVGEAGDGRAAVDLARRHRPDVCLFDVRMPRLDGLAATRELAGPDVIDPLPVVLITTFDLDEYLYEALRNGATGFVLKDAGPDVLLLAARSAANGDALISPSMTRRLIERMAPGDAATQPTDPLTEREESILAGIADGKTNQQIGREHHLALSTVKTHVTNLMQKVGVRNRVELVIWAYDTGRKRPA